MRTNSLAFRLFATAAAWVLLVLPVAGTIIYSLYREEVENSYDRRIGVLLTVILSDSIDHGDSEPGAPKDVGEPLFEITHSGWYWQIKPLDGRPGKLLVSRSLADERIPLPSEAKVEPNDREVRWATLAGPLEQTVRVAETIYVFGEGQSAQRYSVAVAAALEEVENSLLTFRTRLGLALALAGIGLLAVNLFQIRFGLLPLQQVEKGLSAIRSGEAGRLEAALPQEIVPLQQELNALLKSNQDIVERARTHVGNLAHALKTPLAVILNEARDDQSSFARKVSEQAEIMGTQINLYLDRARMAARIGVIGRVTEVRPVGESLIRALERIYQDASKWARSKVMLSVAPMPSDPSNGAHPCLEIKVEDDGPGLTEAQLGEPIIRGRRLDETKPGSGLGHSIVADLAHSYSGRLELCRAEIGGLSVRLTLPQAT
jgi:signal transduction histidine kinase